MDPTQIHSFLTETFADFPAEGIAALSDQQLAEAETSLQSHFQEARDARDLARAQQIVDAVKAVRAEAATRIAQTAELDAEMNPAAPEPEAEPEPVAASGRRMPQAPAKFQLFAKPTATIVAGAAGEPFASPADVARAFQVTGRELHHAGRGSRIVARVLTEYPLDRQFGDDSARNTELYEAAVAEAQSQPAEAIVAAGGLCAPVNTNYDVFALGSPHRPIRDALVRFGATRGGVRWVPAPVLTDAAGGVDIISEAEDTSGPTKPCLTVGCSSVSEELVHAVTQCVKTGNWQRLFHEEQFGAWWKLSTVEHAREAETELWDQMVADSTAVTTGEILGAARDVLENADQAAAAYRSRHRMEPTAPLRLIGPDWIPNIIRADLVRQMPGDRTYGVTNAEINGWFAARSIVPTWSPDVTGNIFGAQGAAPILRWPDTADFLLFAEGTFAFLDGGSLDFGMQIRDSTLNTTNDVQAFVETFEGVAKFGAESLRIRMNLCASGEAAALVDVSVCTTGS